LDDRRPGPSIQQGPFNNRAGDRMRLWNLAPLIPAAERYSRIRLK